MVPCRRSLKPLAHDGCKDYYFSFYRQDYFMVGKVDTIGDVLLEKFDICSMGCRCRKYGLQILGVQALDGRCPPPGYHLRIHRILPIQVTKPTMT